MASTRQFRIGDSTTTETMSAHHNHRQAPYTASRLQDSADTIRPGQPVSGIIPGHVAATLPPTTTITTSSSSSSSAAAITTTTSAITSRSTQAYCRNCRRKIGDFYNSWHRVTGSYYAPALLGSYAMSLHSTGKPKPAAKGTDVEGCTIHLLTCPHPGCGDTPIGFTVIATPAGKRKFRGRDFFKLSRIELQCEITPGQFIIVDPQEDTAPDLSAPEETPSPFSPAHSSRPSPTEAMEVDSRLPSLHHSTYSRSPLGLRYEHNQDSAAKEQSVYLIETDRQPFKTLPSSMPSPPVTNVSHNKTLPPSPPAAEPLREAESPPQKRTVLPEPQDSLTESPVSQETSQINGHQYPRSPATLSMDAIERLQTQISQNSGALAAHTRDIRRNEESFQHLEDTLRREFQDQLFHQSADIQKVEESAARLQHEMQSIRHVMESISREMEAWRMDKQSHKSAFSPGHPLSTQDSALELMAQQIAVMSHKTSDLDNLKLHIEIMKNKIYRLEENAKSGLPQSTSHTYQLQREAGVPPAQPTHATIPSHPSTPTLSHGSDATRRVSNVQQPQPPFGQPAAKVALEPTQRTESLSSQSNGWAAINTGVKRSSHSGMNSPQETTMHAPSSPKRQKLGDAEPFSSYTASHPAPTPAVTDVTDARFSTPAHAVATQNPISDSVPSSQSQQPLYSPYTPQYRASDETPRPDSQPVMGYRTRGRGRGGGPGSRGGRVRKSMLVQPHSSFGTSDWESDEWQGLRSSQGSPEDFHSHMARSGRGGIARRGNGGSGARGGYMTSERGASLGLQGVAAGISFGPPGETYGSAKRTRTKPVRNADGVLIRKDGRPDMRSQSSAANLRKVHARKEQESSHSPTPTNIQYAASAGATDTPSPAGVAATPSATDKHKVIMGKIFPEGLAASQKQHDYASQVFAEDCDHTIHTRSHSHRSAAKADKAAKEEQRERNEDADKEQSPQKHDVDMDDAEDRAENDDAQTPNEPVAQPGKGHEAAGESKAEQNGTLADSRAGSESRVVESSAADDADCIHVKAQLS